MKVISYSLWGNNPKYTVGAIKNAELAKLIYPDWVCRFYVGKDIPKEILHGLIDFSNTEVFVMNETCDWTGSFWRFGAMYDPSVEVMISRDTDSRLSVREKMAVDEWMNSGKSFHIMRDHAWHSAEILAGMWGCFPRAFRGIHESIAKFTKENKYGTDQKWLREEIYPLIKNESVIHDEIHGEKPFPTQRKENEYVGSPFNERDELEIPFYR